MSACPSALQLRRPQRSLHRRTAAVTSDPPSTNTHLTRALTGNIASLSNYTNQRRHFPVLPLKSAALLNILATFRPINVFLLIVDVYFYLEI